MVEDGIGEARKLAGGLSLGGIHPFENLVHEL